MPRLVLLSLLMLFTSGNVYDFQLPSLEGEKIDFAQFKGKKILIVNTASKCGNTPQYADLEKLYRQYQGKLVIVGVPSNDFGKQEPGSNKDISAFCKKEYAITFPMSEKIPVKGEDMHPLYKWLVAESRKKGFEPAEPTWNFQKYLIDEKGNLVAVFKPSTLPLSEAIISAIEKKY